MYLSPAVKALSGREPYFIIRTKYICCTQSYHVAYFFMQPAYLAVYLEHTGPFT